jgi:hypothetical protein
MRFLAIVFVLAALPFAARADEAAVARLKADLLANPSAWPAPFEVVRPEVWF